MKLQLVILAFALASGLWLANSASAQMAPTPVAKNQATSQPANTLKPIKSSAKRPPAPFSGTWALDLQRSTIQGQRPTGSSRAVIEYDGRTWRYRHIHSNSYDQVSDAWDTTLTVGAKTLHVAREEPLTFRSRIYLEKNGSGKNATQGDTLVLQEFVRTDRGGAARNTVRYSLEDGGNTLIETEKSVGAMGTEINRWILRRQAPGEAPPPIDRKDKDD
jgi:hypothetical protein